MYALVEDIPAELDGFAYVADGSHNDTCYFNGEWIPFEVTDMAIPVGESTPNTMVVYQESGVMPTEPGTVVVGIYRTVEEVVEHKLSKKLTTQTTPNKVYGIDENGDQTLYDYSGGGGGDYVSKTGDTMSGNLSIEQSGSGYTETITLRTGGYTYQITEQSTGTVLASKSAG